MWRLGLLTLCAALLYASGAQAHGYHGDCRVGSTWMGVVPHFHPGGYDRAVACGGGGGGGYYGGGGGGYYGGGGGYYRAPRPGDYGPQTNRGQDCYNYYGRRICCPKGWTVQDGRCAPYRGY
ncbi:MAG TPA: hypothetical protein VJL90_11945 [Pseudorhodoplanes sp.]|nr:hypothetical protein [Pseudorhodoplanes sp.]